MQSDVLRIDARLEEVTVKNGQVRYVLLGDVSVATDQLIRASGRECTIGLVIRPVEEAAPNGRLVS